MDERLPHATFSLTTRLSHTTFMPKTTFSLKEYISVNIAIRPDQLDFSFCGSARKMVFFSNSNKNLTKKKTKSLVEAKVLFMVSFRNNRRNIVFLSSAKVVNKGYILTFALNMSD